MAKLMIGSGIGLEVDLGKPEVPREDPDIQAIIDRAIAMLPNQEVLMPKKEDFIPFLRQLEELEHAYSQDMAMIDQRFEDLKVQVDEIAHLELPSPVLVPEVRQITNVKDVSKEVMEHVDANKKELKGDLICHANHIVKIESKLKAQKILNYVLIGIGLLTIFLHFK